LAAQPLESVCLCSVVIALANNCTIVTRNTQEFSRVPGLPLEDWELP
jgi:predicted nucleic acid-binding protein